MQAQLETLQQQLQHYQRITAQDAKRNMDSTPTGNIHSGDASSSPTERPSGGAVCLTTAGAAMMRRARFRRAVSCATTGHTTAAAIPADPGSPSPTPPVHDIGALPDKANSDSLPLTHPTTRRGRVQVDRATPCPQDGRASQEYLDAETASTAAEVGSLLRDSSAMSLPDCSFTFQSPHAQGVDAGDGHGQQPCVPSYAAAIHGMYTSVGGCIAPQALAVCGETHRVTGAAPNLPEARSEAPKLPRSEIMWANGCTQETESMRAALEASKAQNTQLRASVAAMRAEIELLQQRQLRASTDLSAHNALQMHSDVQIEHRSSRASCTQHTSQQCIPSNPGVTASEGAVAVCIDSQEHSREGSGMCHDHEMVEHARPEGNQALVLHEANVHASPDRDNSGPFSSIRDASLRAASLHAAIIAATGGESSARHALEGVLGSIQHAQVGCSIGVQVPEYLVGDKQEQQVRKMSDSKTLQAAESLLLL